MPRGRGVALSRSPRPVLVAVFAILSCGESAKPDNQAPDVALALAPCCLVTIPGTQLTLTATASDNAGVQHVAFVASTPSRPAGVRFADDSTAPYSTIYPPTGFAVDDDGAYVLAAVAYDAVGNFATDTVALTVAIDVTPPVVTVSAPPGRVTFNVAFPVTVNASEPVLKIELYDGDSLVTSAFEPTLPRTLYENLTAAHNGVRILKTRVWDRAGNVTDGPSDAVVVDIRWVWDSTARAWDTEFRGVVAGAGGVYAGGSHFGSGALLTRMDSSGTTLWERRFTEPGWGNYGQSVARDRAGAVYLGIWRFRINADARDCVLVKYDATGNALWNRVIDSGDWEGGCRVAADSNGGIYVAGSTLGKFDSVATGRIPVVFVAKYDSDGNRIWIRQVAALLFESDFGGLAADPAGATYVTGVDSTTPSIYGSMFVLKLDGSGNELWKRFFLGDANTAFTSAPFRGAVAVDSVGAVYATGVITSPMLVKYDASGTLLWSREVVAGVPAAVTIDANGVYVAGEASDTLRGILADANEDIILARFDGNGAQTDLRSYAFRGGRELGFDVAAAGNGVVYVGGAQWTYPRGVVLKYQP